MIKTNSVLFSLPSSFNDPFDCRFNPPSDKSDVDEFFKAYLEHTFILCLTEDPNNILLWSHYADMHKGLCIGYDFPYQQLLRKEVNGFYLDRMKYLNKIPNVKSYTTEILLNHSKRNRWLRDMVYTKAQCWKYEKEVRIMTSTQNLESRFVGSPGGTINTIVFGAKCPNIEEIKHVIKSSENFHPSYKFISYKYACLNNTSFKLNFLNSQLSS